MAIVIFCLDKNLILESALIVRYGRAGMPRELSRISFFGGEL